MPVADRMVRAVQRILHIANDRVDPGESFQRHTGRASASQSRLPHAGIQPSLRSEAVQFIGDNKASEHQMPLGPLGNLPFAKSFQPGEAHRVKWPARVGAFRLDGLAAFFPDRDHFLAQSRSRCHYLNWVARLLVSI